MSHLGRSGTLERCWRPLYVFLSTQTLILAMLHMHPHAYGHAVREGLLEGGSPAPAHALAAGRLPQAPRCSYVSKCMDEYKAGLRFRMENCEKDEDVLWATSRPPGGQKARSASCG